MNARPPLGQERPLHGLFAPASVAVVGASSNPEKWGYQYARQLLAGPAARRAWLVNARGEPVLGQATHASLRALPEAPELAVICVPVDKVMEVVEDGLAIGVRYFVCITTGFSETGSSGRAAERRLVEAVRRGGARLVGPNCAGLYDAAAQLSCTAFWDLPAGDVGLISQSGGVIVELGIRLPRMGLGISRAVSVGNQADLSTPEFVEAFAADPNTRLVVAYAEDFHDGRRLFAAIETARRCGKEVVLVAPSASEAIGRAVSSHTGSMVSDEDVLQSICQDLDVVRVRGLSDLMLALRGLSAPRRASGQRAAVIADGGGSATLGTEAVQSAGLAVPAFSPALAGRLKQLLEPPLSPDSAVGNPIDLVGALDLGVFRPVIDTIARSGEVDAIVLNGAFNDVAGADAAKEASVADDIERCCRENGVALAVAAMLPDEPAMQQLRLARVPVLDYPTDAARCVAFGKAPLPRRTVPRLPAASHYTGGRDYLGARAALSGYEISFAQAAGVSTGDEAARVAREFGYPVVLKALGTEHKSDAGAVVLNIPDEATLRGRLADLSERLQPPGFSVEQMVVLPHAMEVLVGAHRDRNFGPTVTVAAGGTRTEVLRDKCVAVAPVDEAYAMRMLQRLRMAPLFTGFRGSPPVELAAVARVVVGVARFLVEHADVTEVEINPLLVSASRVVAVDARLAVRPAAVENVLFEPVL